MNARKVFRCAAATLCFLAAATAHLEEVRAQDSQHYADQVWVQLQEVYATVVEQGRYDLRNYIVSSMSDDRTDSWTFSFSPNRSYLITGACDEDCSDIDIYIKNASGTVVAKDEQADDLPALFFSPRSAGRYTIQVKMYACRLDPCYFGFGMFQSR